MKIEKNLFDLTDEGIETSKMLYNNKIIKCLVAPYHTERSLEIEYAPNIFLFPEREMTHLQTKKFVSMLVNSKFDEIQIITTSVDVIYDMVAVCVRVLTEHDTIVDCPTQTFAANQHDIIHTVLNNKNHQLSDYARGAAVIQIQGVLDKVRNAASITEEEAAEYLKVVNLVGEPLIKNSIKDQIYDKTVRSNVR